MRSNRVEVGSYSAFRNQIFDIGTANSEDEKLGTALIQAAVIMAISGAKGSSWAHNNCPSSLAVKVTIRGFTNNLVESHAALSVRCCAPFEFGIR